MRPEISLHRPFYDDGEERAVLRVLRSGRLAGNGEECAALERELGLRFDCRFVLATSSASHALEMAMLLLEVDGGEVIMPSFTFPSAGNAVIRAGATPVFCEIRRPDLNPDLDHLRSLLGPRTRAVILTHYAGHPVVPSEFGVPVVEDAAPALGSTVEGRACGTLGRLGCFSFHHTKNLAAGEGGALICEDAELAQRA